MCHHRRGGSGRGSRPCGYPAGLSAGRPQYRPLSQPADRLPCAALLAIGEDLGQLRDLGEASLAIGIRTRLLIDVDLGMHRTGVPLEGLEAFYRSAARLPGWRCAACIAMTATIPLPS